MASFACSHPSMCSFESGIRGIVLKPYTSRHPDDLYKNGIQRSSFIPAIELLKSRFEVTDLDSGTGLCMMFTLLTRCLMKHTDYRRIPRALSHVYYDPLTPENAREVEKIFTSMTSSDPEDPVIRNRPLETWGRVLLVPESTSKVAKFKFQDLCGRPYSASDYIEVTKKFGTVFLVDVPKMGMNHKDLVGNIVLHNTMHVDNHTRIQARRFITFIDGQYSSS
jgi:peroxisome-assembly ATPase